MWNPSDVAWAWVGSFSCSHCEELNIQATTSAMDLLGLSVSGKKRCIHTKNLYTNVHRSTVPNSWRLEITQIPITWWVDTFNVYLYNGISVQFSHSVVSDSLQPHELQHARPPCPSPTPRVLSDSRPSSQWCHPAISSSVIPFSSCPQSLPASESFPNNGILGE